MQNVLLDTFLLPFYQHEGIMESKMLREITNDTLTPKKKDKKEAPQDFYERLSDPDDGFDYEIESYEVITEYR